MANSLSPDQRLVLSHLRKWAGLTQLDLGSRAEPTIERSKIAYIETGGMAPSEQEMQSIERVFRNLEPDRKSRITKFLCYMNFNAEHLAFVERLMGIRADLSSQGVLSRSDILKHQREQMGLSQRALAAAAGIPRYRILMIEASESEISEEERDKIGEVLGFSKSSSLLAKEWYGTVAADESNVDEEIRELQARIAELEKRKQKK